MSYKWTNLISAVLAQPAEVLVSEHADALHKLGVLFAECLIEIPDERERKLAVIQLCWDIADACEQTPLGDAVARLGREIEETL